MGGFRRKGELFGWGLGEWNVGRGIRSLSLSIGLSSLLLGNVSPFHIVVLLPGFQKVL